jgi:hypothetical protein
MRWLICEPHPRRRNWVRIPCGACAHCFTEHMLTLRLSRVIPLAIALLTLAAGCGKQEAAPKAGPYVDTPPSLKIMHVGNGTEPEDLDPHVVTGVQEHKIITALLEGLVTYSPTGEIAPGVAEHWTISDDGLVYTFHSARQRQVVERRTAHVAGFRQFVQTHPHSFARFRVFLQTLPPRRCRGVQHRQTHRLLQSRRPGHRCAHP